MAINGQHAMPFTLSISTRLLKTGNALFRVMRPLLFLINAEALYEFGGPVIRRIKKAAFREDKKAI